MYTTVLRAAKVLIALEVKPFITVVQSMCTSIDALVFALDVLTPEERARQRHIDRHLARCAQRRDRRRRHRR